RRYLDRHPASAQRRGALDRHLQGVRRPVARFHRRGARLMEPKQAVQVAPERSASPPRRLWRPDSNSWLLPAAFIVLLIVAWQLVTQFTPWFKPYILPQPWDVV